MRKLQYVVVLLVVVSLSLGAVIGMGCGEDTQYTMGISQIVTHPALDAIADGFKDALAEEGYTEGDNLEFTERNAEGDMPTSQTIAQTLISMNPDLILGISTPSTQHLAQAQDSAGTEIPIVFGALTNPVAAGILDDPEHPGGHITGVHDLGPIDQHVELMLEFSPNMTTIGTIYNPGEANSVFQIEILQDILDTEGLALLEAPVSTSADVLAAAQSLIGRCDVIYIVTDNTAVTGLSAIVGVCEENDIPLFTGDTTSVEDGAMASIGPSFYSMGLSVGKIAARILEGENPGDIAVTGGEPTLLVVNESAAARMGLTIPQSVLDRADEIITE